MKKISHSNWKLLIRDSMSESEAKRLFDIISTQGYSITSSLKDHHRSIVKRIAIDNQDYVLKIPLEKNQRPWIRFLTWFRLGEAFKNMHGMIKLWNVNIKTTIPVMAAESRTYGMVTDSWLLYKYLDGQSCLDQQQHYDAVVRTLSGMHKKGYLHGDSQIRNFLAVQDEIYVIDANPKPVGWTGFKRAFEFAYLKRSNPEIENHFGEIKDWWLYKFAESYDLNERAFSSKKRKFKQKIKAIFQ